jgi:hypothetical protein
MKKLMTAFAACMMAGMVSAQVESQNVVGYSTMNLYIGWNMVALNWAKVADVEAGMSVQNVIPDALGAGLTGGSNPGEADQIQIRNNQTGGGTILYLFDRTKTAYPDDPAAIAAHNKWLDGAAVSSVVLKPGDAFWYKRYNAGAASVAVAVAGQVPNDASKTKAIYAGWNMQGSAFTADFAPNGGAFDWLTAGAVGGSNPGEADQIQIRNNATGGGTILYLFDRTKTAYPDDPANIAAHNNWMDGAAVSSAVVPQGNGMWYYHRGTGFDWTETKPYTLN